MHERNVVLEVRAKDKQSSPGSSTSSPFTGGESDILSFGTSITNRTLQRLKEKANLGCHFNVSSTKAVFFKLRIL